MVILKSKKFDVILDDVKAINESIDVLSDSNNDDVVNIVTQITKCMEGLVSEIKNVLKDNEKNKKDIEELSFRLDELEDYIDNESDIFDFPEYETIACPVCKEDVTVEDEVFFMGKESVECSGCGNQVPLTPLYLGDNCDECDCCCDECDCCCDGECGCDGDCDCGCDGDCDGDCDGACDCDCKCDEG